MTHPTDAMSSKEPARDGGLLRWQRDIYGGNHRDRGNLALHVVAVPLFQLGTCAALLAPLVTWWLAIAGVVAMAGAMALQGRGHARERVSPVPFRGAGDAVARIFAEQWITFPRFVLSGQLARAWRDAPR